MANPWFRMYGEFATDPKVQSMPESMQRRLLMVMCLRCSNALATLHATEIAFAMRLTDDELAETKALFVQKKFIDESWNLLNWDKRQFASDSSTARSRRHREGKATAMQRQRNGVATPPDTDTDTDTDTEKERRKKKKKKKPSPAATALPDPPSFVDADAWTGFVAMRTRIRHPLTARAAALIHRELAKLRDAGHDPNRILDNSTRNGWRDVFAPRNGEPTSGTHRESLAERADRKCREGDERDRASG